MKIRKPIVLLAVCLGLLAYHNSFSGTFVFDDYPSILDNPQIQHLWPPWNLVSHTSRPVVHLSLAVNYALGGLNPWGYHLFNLGIHILAALTLYEVLRRTFLSETLRPKFGQASSSLAGAIALIWLVHPLQTESVTYTIQRCESLMSLFYLLTLYCVIRSDDSTPGKWWRIGAVVSCGLGIGCKPVMVTAPLVTLLYDRVFLAKSWHQIWQRRRGLYAGLAATWLLLPALLANAPAEWKTSAGFEFKVIPPLQYAQLELVVIVRYLRLAFWPQPLCLDYGWQFHWQAMAGKALPDLLVVAVLLTGTVWAWKHKPALGFAGVWFFLILAPTSSFIPIYDPIAEHRMYLPLAAVVTVVVVAAYALGKKLLGNRPGAALGWVAGGLVIVPLTVLTIQRNDDYRSLVAILQDTASKCPDNPRAPFNLGVALSYVGQTQEEIRQFEQALRINPNYPEAHLSVGIALWKMGQTQEAIGHFEQALQIRPTYLEAHNILGVILSQAGQTQEAIRHFEQALRINPDNSEVRKNLEVARSQVGQTQEAIGHFEQTVRLKPDDAHAYYDLGNALLQVGKTQEAIGSFKQAVQIRPDYPEAHFSLGSVLSQLGQTQEAIGHFEQALRIKPDFAEAHNNLGNLLFQAGQTQEAIAHFEQALRIRPDFAEAHNNLGTLLLQVGKTEEAIGHFEQALLIRSDNPDAHNNLGYALLQSGKTQAAIGHFEQALRIKPDYAEAHFSLGNALSQVGKTQEAIAHFEQALRIKPDFADARAALAQAKLQLRDTGNQNQH